MGYEANIEKAWLGLIQLKSKIDNKISIYIDKHQKTYKKEEDCGAFEEYSSKYITIQEHQLLNELFNLWGWINEEH